MKDKRGNNSRNIVVPIAGFALFAVFLYGVGYVIGKAFAYL